MPASTRDPAGVLDLGSLPRRVLLATAGLAVGAAALVAVGAAARSPSPPSSAPRLYTEHCAACHGTARYGGYAPPLYTDSLARKKDAVLVSAILEGLPNTQMPAFGDRLSEEDARGLIGFLRAPLSDVSWGPEEITASRLESPVPEQRIPERVRREAIILVVERATGSIAVLDGDRLSELDRVQVGRIHGGPKFDRALRRVYAATRDGTLVEYDLERGGERARAKVGVNTRNIAVSPDGAFVAAANQLPRTLVVMDGGLRPIRSILLPDEPSGVYHVPGQSRFLLALRNLPRLLSVSLPDLELREVELPEPFEDFALVPGRPELVASSRAGKRLILYDLAEERVRATLPTVGLPHLFSACFFERDGRRFAAFNHIGVPRLSIVDMETFAIEREISLRGSGYFARTHPETPYLWVDTNTGEIQLVEKEGLRLLDRTLEPEKGKKAMHVEFTADGDRALVSVWHEDGAVVAYDSTSLVEVARIPFAMPVGKYNARNRTREGDPTVPSRPVQASETSR